MDIIRVILAESINEHSLNELKKLGFYKGKEYYGYINEGKVNINLNGLGISLNKEEVVVTQTSEEVISRVKSLREKGIYIKLIN